MQGFDIGTDMQTMAEANSDIADFIRQAYSEHGAEIGAQGASSLTVNLPAEFPVTAFCADLWNEFNAPVEFKYGPQHTSPVLTVWTTTKPRPNPVPEAHAHWHAAISHAAMVCVGVLAVHVTGTASLLTNVTTAWPFNNSFA